jgi:hypothetical protein
MYRLKTRYTAIVLSVFIGCVFFACDEDFNTIDSAIEINDNFNSELEKYAVKGYTKKLAPVQTNSLPINAIGIYKDGYGTTTSSVVSQLAPSSFNPVFPNNTVFDSIVLTIPYFSTLTDTDEDINSTFELDSIIGNSPIKLSVFQSNYFLRDFAVDDEFSGNLEYFSNRTNSENNPISSSDLESIPLYVDEEFTTDARQVKFFDEDGEITARSNPAIRMRLDNFVYDIDEEVDPNINILQDLEFWQTLILDKEGEPELSNFNNFNNYIRGLYIKAEALSDQGTLMLLNTSSSAIQIYYTRDDNDTDGDNIPNYADVDIDGDGVLDNGEDSDGDGVNDASDVDETGGVDENGNQIDDSIEENSSNSFSLNFNGTSVNFLDNQITTPVIDGDPTTGDPQLFLKGGEGSMAVLELFDDAIDGSSLENFITEFRGDDIENPKRLINEAFLNLYVDQTFIDGQEPDRIYIYDIKNEIPLIDYFVDQSFANTPAESKTIHLQPLERVGDEIDGAGIRYKIRITEHLNNILLRDSSNVKLGLVVSKSVGLENDTNFKYSVDTDDEDFDYIPLSSIISPRGTVLHGTTSQVPDDKRIELEIYYTEPEFN